MAVEDIAGGGDEVWEQAISKLKQRFTFRHWEVGKGKFCSREVVQAADGSMRVGQPAYTKSLDFVPLGKLRKEQSGYANLIEKTGSSGISSSTAAVLIMNMQSHKLVDSVTSWKEAFNHE